jgi:two-component system chemotaxis response regulator CheY
VFRANYARISGFSALILDFRQAYSEYPGLLFSMKKILIVDDSPTMRRMVAAALQGLTAVMFEEASNGLEAVEILTRGGVALMILDLNMPDMHGLDVLRFVRSHGRYKTTPIIVLTTKYDSESKKSAVNAGASDYLTKPFEPRVLLEHVSQLVQTT